MNINELLGVKFESRYGLQQMVSSKSELFIYIPLTNKLDVSRIVALRMRIATSKSKYYKRNNSIYDFDVKSIEQAKRWLNNFHKFNFNELENRFDTLYDNDLVIMKGNKDTREWLKVIIPQLREEFMFKYMHSASHNFELQNI